MINERTEKVGITIPSEIVRKLDANRGDVPRSKFVYRALEFYFKKSMIAVILGVLGMTLVIVGAVNNQSPIKTR